MTVVALWMIAAGFSVFGLLFAAGGLIPLRRGREVRARDRATQAHETTPIADLEPGIVEVRGTARPIEGEGRVSGVTTERDALASSFEIENFDMRGRGEYHLVFASYDAVPFVIDDGTDEVRVDPPTSTASRKPMETETRPPTTGRYELAADETTEVDVGESAPEPIQRYQDAHGIDEEIKTEVAGIGGTYRRRYTEGFLEPGETVTVQAEYHEAPAGWDTPGHVLGAGDAPDSFLLTDGPVDDVRAEGSTNGTLLYVGGILAIGGGVFAAVIPWLLWLLL